MQEVLHSARPIIMINSIYTSLTRSEQKVADVVKKQLKDIIYWSVSDLADHSDVGETTVIRFCRRLGYKGYQDFKLAVAQSSVESTEPVFGEIEESDSPDIFAQKVTTENNAILQNTLSLVDPGNIELAAKKVIAANKIYLFGVGASGVMAQQAQYRFMRLGFHAQYATDAHIIAMNCALAEKDDVVIGISTSGSTKDIVDAIEIASRNGAFVICITSHMKSPITKFGDIILLTVSKESPLHGGALSSLISQLHMMDILTRYIEYQREDQSLISLQKTAKSVSDKLY